MERWRKVIAAAVLAVLPMSAVIAAPAPKAKKAPAAKAPPVVAVRPAPVDPRLTPPVATMELKDGDSIVFLGDSITHQCLYTQYLENYIYTRFPNIRVKIHNSGVGGDRAADALARFDVDVAAYKPKYVTILLGMNDGTYKQWDKETFANYERDMLALLDKIKGIGATAIVMGPSMYDRGATLIKPSPRRQFDSEAGKYYNAVLAFYGTFMRDQALERGLAYVDMFAALNKYTIEQRQKDPNFTMIPDAVHPDANGQAVMAVSLLEAMHMPHPVAATTAIFDGGAWKVTVGGGKVSDIQGDANGLSFTSTDPCLPWILPEEAAIGYKLSVAGHHFSPMAFRVTGLSAGRYEVKIDGVTIGTFPSGLLSFKIELQNFDKCPQYQQSLAVANLNKEKNDKAMHPIRDLYRDLKVLKRKQGVTEQAVAAFVEQMKPKLQQLETLKASYEEKIYAAAQPKPHKFEIVKVGK